MTGVEASYDGVFNQHYAAVLRYATAKVGPDDAEDVVSEAFTGLWKHWQETDNPVAYLYGAVKNAVKSEYKQRQRRPVPGLELPDSAIGFLQEDDDQTQATARLLERLPFDVPISAVVVAAELAEGHDRPRVAELTGMPLRDVHRSVRLLRKTWPHLVPAAKAESDPQLIEQAVRALPPRQREVLVLSALGLKPRRIAALLDIGDGSARTNLSYARRRARAAIGGTTQLEVGTAVAAAVGVDALLGMLPDTQWKRDAVALRSSAARQMQKDTIANIRRGVDPDRAGAIWRRQVALERSSSPVVDRYLKQISMVIAVARNGMTDQGLATAGFGCARFPDWRYWRSESSSTAGWLAGSGRRMPPIWLGPAARAAWAEIVPVKSWQASAVPACSPYLAAVPSWPAVPRPAFPEPPLIEAPSLDGWLLDSWSFFIDDVAATVPSQPRYLLTQTPWHRDKPRTGAARVRELV